MNESLNEKMQQAAEAAEAENRLWQNRWSSKREIQEAEEAADVAYAAVIDELYGSGNSD